MTSSFIRSLKISLKRLNAMLDTCCGTSMQTLKYSEELLHATFEKHSPKVVILETDRIYKSPILWGWVSSQLIPTFSVLTYHNRWKTMDAKEVGAEPNYTHLCDFKGYTYSSAVVAASANNHMSATSKSQYINLVNRNYIKKMQKFIENLVMMKLKINLINPQWDYLEVNNKDYVLQGR